MSAHKDLRPAPALLASLVLALSCLVVATPAAAQWKWTERVAGKDVTQYSDLPPPASVPEANILQRPAAGVRRVGITPQAQTPSLPASASAPSSRGVDPGLEAATRKKEQDAAAAHKADEARVAAERAENCTRAKSAMRTLDDGMRIARVNAAGEREILNDQQRAAEVQRTRDVMTSECGAQ